MTECHFLAHIIDTFGTVLPVLVLADPSGKCREVSLGDLALTHANVVTYDAARLVDLFKYSSQRLPNTLVDIRIALRLLSGVARDEGGESLWDAVALLRDLIPSPADGKTFKDLIEARIPRPSRSELIRIASLGAVSLSKLWEKLTQELKQNDEERRLFEIEIPVQQIFFNRQLKGIALDNDALKASLSSAQNDKYSAFLDLAKVLKFSPAGLNYRNVGDFLPGTDASHLGEFANQSNLEDYFDIARYRSSFAATFLRFKRAERDVAILTRTQAGADRNYPIFDCFGTVTGRILVTEPRLQELRKTFRNIIAPDPANELVYLDYAQFEPGILAALTNDKRFIDLYNKTDLYEALSIAVFGNTQNRSLCKSIFLAYCYGMSITNIAKILAGSDFSLETSARYHETVSTFFAEFPSLEKFRVKSCEALMERGFVSSSMGNRRIRKSQGSLTAKERRWAVNQIVQGTASLIFKTALIRIAEEFGFASILLPMHDAVLLQYDPAKLKRETFEASVKTIMIAAFSMWCPNARPKVVSTEFAVPEVMAKPPQADAEQLNLPFG
jgi:DNA polymerase I-like protein with 3'-5' exonuclease and polymerase domains